MRGKLKKKKKIINVLKEIKYSDHSKRSENCRNKYTENQNEFLEINISE